MLLAKLTLLQGEGCTIGVNRDRKLRGRGASEQRVAMVKASFANTEVIARIG